MTLARDKDCMISTLYIDDEKGLLEISKIFLETDANICVTTCETASSALMMLSEDKYDVIVSDYQMPVMDGIDLLKSIRSCGDSTPFIIFTGKGREEIAVEAFDNGADFYMQKGGDIKSQFTELRSKIKYAYRRRKAEERIKRSEANLQTLFNSIEEMIFILDRSCNILRVNKAVRSTLGYSEEDLLRKNMMDLQPLSTRDEAEKALNAILNGEKEVCDIPLLDSSGTQIPVETNLSIGQWDEKEVLVGVSRNIEHRRRIEEALKQSEMLNRTLLSNIPAYIFLYSEDCDIIYANKIAADRLGYGRSELIGSHIKDLVVPEHREIVSRKSEMRRNHEYVPPYEIDIMSKNGERKTVEVRGQQITYDGAPSSLIVLNDVTELKRVAKALEKSDEMYRLISNYSIDVIWTMDMDGRFTYISPSVEQLRGYTVEEAMSQTLEEMVSSESKEEVTRLFIESRDTIISGGALESHTYEFRQTHKDGHEIWVEIVARPTYDDDGRPTGFIGVTRNIEERKRAEKILRANENRFRYLADNGETLIWTANTSGKCDYFNRPWLEFTGRALEEELDDGWIEDVHPNDREKCFDIYTRAFESREKFNMSYRLLHRSGEYRWIQDDGVPWFDDDGNFKGYIGHCFDIHERVVLEQALKVTNKKMNLLSSVTRHDILNQLVALQGYIDLVLERPDNPRNPDMLRKMMVPAQNIHRQITFTREYQDLGLKSPEWQSLPELTKDLSSEHLRISKDLDGLSVYADPLLIKVFLNLTDNSERHGKGAKEIRIEHNINGDGSLDVIFSDDGQGIPDDDKERIFQRGFGSNTGLGLFLIKEILEITGISIRENGIYGEGARFEMNIPKERWKTDTEPES